MFKLFKRWAGKAPSGQLPPEDTLDTSDSVRRPRRDFKKLYPRDMSLSVEVEDNPKRAGTQAAARFDKYWEASTVGEALDAGALYKDIDVDWVSGYIRLGGRTTHG